MSELPPGVWLMLAVAVILVGVPGLRGLMEIHGALRLAEFDRLNPPAHWSAARALVGLLAAIPVLFVMRQWGIAALAAGAVMAAVVYVFAPALLASRRRRVECEILDDLGLHLDLLALAHESGSQWPAALALCLERAPEGALKRAWQRVILEIHAGSDPLDALRGLEQRIRLAPLTTLVSSLKAAEKLQVPAASVLRDRARQSAASRFARAERRARAAPIKLWAAMLLCLAPCTAVVLAFPLARLLGLWFG
jgi:tight adherence protein C